MRIHDARFKRMTPPSIAHKRTSDDESQPLITHLREVGELVTDLATDSGTKPGVVDITNQD